MLKGATTGMDRFVQPSTGTMSGGKIIFANSKLNELNDPTVPPSKGVSLQLARFIPVE
jgi:hypothetical protein